MLELFQTEWCPASRRIRQRLTEFGLGYVNRQVLVDRDERSALYAATGPYTVPALVLEDGSAVVGEAQDGAVAERAHSGPTHTTQ